MKTILSGSQIEASTTNGSCYSNLGGGSDVEVAIDRQPLTIDRTAALSEAIALMSASEATCSMVCDLNAKHQLMFAQSRSSCILVLEKQRLVGILTERDLVRLAANSQNLTDLAVTDVMTAPPITLRQSDFNNLLVPVGLFKQHRIRHLPLVDDQGNIIGIVTQDSLRQLLRPIDLFHLRLVGEVMTTEVIYALPTANIVELTHLMTVNNISSVIIVNAVQDLKPIGIVTERDVIQFLALEIDFELTTAQSVMSTPVFSVSANASLWSVRTLMQDQHINRVVVTDSQGSLQGIVTQSSLLGVLNPIEIYQMMESLEQKVCRLELEQLAFLANRNAELELQVQQRTQELEKRVAERTADLQASQRFIERIAEASPDFLYLFDVQKRHNLYTNRDLGKCFGYADSQTSAMGEEAFLRLMHPEDILKLQEHEEQLNAAPDGTVVEFPHRMRHANGKWIWFNSRNSVFSRDSQGRIQQIIGTSEDISDRLEHERQLEQSNVELLRATRLKDEFLANMSHELRTPLNAILGMSEILTEEVHGTLNEKQLRSVTTIEKSGRHLLELINDILELSKIEAGKLELSLSQISISNLCQSSVTFIKQLAFQKSINLTVNIPTDLREIVVDERRMRQVFINLLNNAVKFTPQGGHIVLNVHLEQSADPYYLYFSIRDSGIGIAATDLHKLFKSFSQIDSSLNRNYEGTGLGLALVKQIVELHGGIVTVQSELGQGSCFTVKIPYGNPSSLLPKTAASPPVSVAAVVPEAMAAQPSPLILLAEDNQANVEIIAAYLEANGYRLLIAANGQEAINLTRSHQPDLILMDIQMPKLDGIAAMRCIRQDLQITTIPIIALTALAMPGDREKFLAAGANEYLAKPVKLKELLKTLQTFLQTEKS